MSTERVFHPVTELTNSWFWEEELEHVPEPEWLLEQTLPKRSINMLFGEFNTGKTFLALDWALSIAAGWDWLGKKSQQGDVLYIASEGDPGNLAQRVASWKTERGRNVPLPVLFYADVMSITGVGDLMDQAKSDGLRPSLVIIDTLAMALDDEENSNTVMNNAIKELRSLQTYEVDDEHYEVTFLLVHHSGWADDGRPRGATAMPAGLDNVIGMKPGKAEGHLEVWMYKGKNMDKLGWGRPVFKLEEVGDSVVLRYQDVATVKKDTLKSGALGAGVGYVVAFLTENPGEEFTQADIRKWEDPDKPDRLKSVVKGGIETLLSAGYLEQLPGQAKYREKVGIDEWS
jgi:hypothetical protein